jgi:hypothetical protein
LNDSNNYTHLYGLSTATIHMALTTYNNMLHQLSAIGVVQCQALSNILRFCHKAGGENKIQPSCWQAQNPKREIEDPKKPLKERGTQKEKKRSGMEKRKTNINN